MIIVIPMITIVTIIYYYILLYITYYYKYKNIMTNLTSFSLYVLSKHRAGFETRG